MSGNRRLLFMLPVLLIAGWLALFGDKTPSDSAEVVAPLVVASSSAPAAEAVPEVVAENPAITGETDASQVRRLRDRQHLAVLETAPKVDLFGANGGVPAPPPAQVEAPPPPPPTQPFTLIGRMFDRDHWLAFLEKDSRTNVVRAGDVLEGFRIDAVSGREVRLTQLVDKTAFVIPIDGDKKD